MQTVMDNLTEDVNEELDMSNDSEALLQSNQSIDNVSLDGNTASTDKTKGLVDCFIVTFVKCNLKFL